MLKIERRRGQAIVLEPVSTTDQPMILRVVEILPNSVGIGFEGTDYRVIRSEIYKNGGIDTNDNNNSSS
jgi:sRNA-binding carbon storage regulator CsrA